VTPGDDEARAFFTSNEVSSVTSGSGNLFFASFDGYVRIVGQSWKIARSFRAHDAGSITHMRQVEGTSYLVTVAEDLSNEPVLKVWALDKPIKKTGVPTCLSEIKIGNAKRQFPISAFTATSDLSQLAVGFANGAVVVVRGDLIHDRGTKQRIVFESEEPVTGVELRVDEKLTTLFFSTTNRILKIVISGKGQGHPPKTVEDLGCAVGCMTVEKKSGDIVVARQDAIYYYTLDGRGPPRAYEAPKDSIQIFGDYIAVVSPPATAPASDESERLRKRLGTASADVIFNTSTFQLLETDLRIIAHTEAVISKVLAVFQIWGDLYTLTHDGKIFRYHEKPLSQRLEMLYQRNLFVLAIELAQKSGVPSKGQKTIFQRFGDYLYQKGDYDGAMAQYIKAIDSTEPSQVIRKFLDTQRIHNLIEYLEELHRDKKATPDHTTLLLNCYAKLKDVDKLDKFIKAPGELLFDVDTAITMCRQGGYYEQAAYLAQKHGEMDLVVDVLIEDSKKYADALDYIWHLPPESVCCRQSHHPHVMLGS
jgi:vacuolar protein sorting-associated protein 11